MGRAPENGRIKSLRNRDNFNVDQLGTRKKHIRKRIDIFPCYLVEDSAISDLISAPATGISKNIHKDILKASSVPMLPFLFPGFRKTQAGSGQFCAMASRTHSLPCLRCSSADPAFTTLPCSIWTR